MLHRCFCALGVLWGAVGVVALLLFSVQRLGQVALTFFTDMTQREWWHWLALALWLLFMAYSKGYRAFQLAFAPRVAARLHWLYHHPQWFLLLLAPLYAMGLIYASKKRMMMNYAIVAMILVFVIFAEYLPVPWRAIVYAGVVVGLFWGTCATVWFSLRIVLATPTQVDPELPRLAQ